MGWKKVAAVQSQMYTISELALLDARNQNIFAISYADLQTRHPELPINNILGFAFSLTGDLRHAVITTGFDTGSDLSNRNYKDAVFTKIGTSDNYTMSLTRDLSVKSKMNIINNPENNSWVDIW